jgi:mono/diheme cytochrome c family protein
MGGRIFSSRAALAVAALLLWSPVVSAQEESARTLSDADLIGDPSAGRALAEAVCAECHGIAPGVTTSPVPEATPFIEIAETPGMTSRALTVWLTTFHPGRTMPAILLERSEREDVIAYILSLAQE